MTFVAVPPEDATPEGQKVACGPFWPDIDINDFRNKMRVGGTTLPAARLQEAIEGAVLTALNDLIDWQAAQTALGYDTLADVPSIALGGETRLTIAWRRAVYAYATADLTETHRDMGATPTGMNRTEPVILSADDHRRNGLQAVRDILGVNRVTSELI